MSSGSLPPQVDLVQDVWYTPTVYVLGTLVYLVFGGIATYLAISKQLFSQDLQSFITARNTQGIFILIWSFYGSLVGSYVAFSPASFTGGLFPAGWIGAAAQAFSTAAPLIFVPPLGVLILRKHKNVTSFSDFIRLRFGNITYFFTSLVLLFNMCAFLISEYTGIGSLFASFVDPTHKLKHPDVYIILVSAVTVSIYTAIGGLQVSLYTDFMQGTFSVLMVVIAVIWVAAKFRYPLLPDKFELGMLGRHNYTGQGAFAALTIGQVTGAVYNEAFWQRVWAAKNPRVVLISCLSGSIIVFVVTFFFAAMGVLSFWAGLPPLDSSGNLTFFTIFGSTTQWVTVLIVMCVCALDQASADSFQNGLLSVIYTFVMTIQDFRKGGQSEKLKQLDDLQNEAHEGAKKGSKLSPNMKFVAKTFYYRVAVVAINVVAVPIAVKNFNLISIFFVTNEITTIITFPQLIGLVVHPHYYKQIQMFISLAITFISPHLYSYFKLLRMLKMGSAPTPDASASSVFSYTWRYEINNYDYGIPLTPFIVGFLSSVILTGFTVVIKRFILNMKVEQHGAKDDQQERGLYRDLFDWRIS